MLANLPIPRRPGPLVAVVAVVCLAGCGKKAPDPSTTKDDAAPGPTVAPLVMPPIGVDHIRRMNFVYGDGWHAYDKAVAAVKANQPDAARAHVESSISKDPMHLDAHYLFARLLARSGEHAAAVDHLVSALAGDYYKYGPAFAKEPDLAEFRATAHGQALTALAAKIGEAYAARVPGALWLVARRSRFKWPRERGTEYASSRGEVYAYDRAGKRFFRLTHTNHKVVAYVRAASAPEIAIVGFDKIDRPKQPDVPVTFAAAWVQRIDAKTWQPLTDKASVPAARELAIGYGPGDQLVVAADAAVFTVDKAGKLVEASALPVPRLALTVEEGRRIRTPEGIRATWTGEPPTAPLLETATGKKITIPESGATLQASVATAPDGARVAFVTAVDPCRTEVAPSLYIADAKTGAHRHVLTARSRFAPRWLEANLLAYEDGEGAIRVWDAAASRQAYKIENTPGIALDVLSLAAAPRCINVPEPDDPDGGPDEPPLPPEEPVTMPQ